MKFKKTVLTLGIASLLTGCVMTDNQRTAVGAGVGAVLGGVVGHQIHHKNGRYVGAVLGALAGGAIARYMDNQQQALEKALRSSGISVVRVDQKTIKLVLPNAITFAVDSANVKGGVRGYLSSIAAVVNKYNKTAVHTLGHADSTGDASYNMSLSQRRAESVANYLAGQGVVRGRIVATGYGESYPIASNATRQGRAQNRRVEIYIRAIEQGNEQAAYSPIY
ncbi:MAG: cell envelope biogenesis protein OmpA [Gammaproteobacteria bacterium]|nr:MAG: cell envelope biogenesis protein OmpA [Gammaproteobacteria bacterium]